MAFKRKGFPKHATKSVLTKPGDDIKVGDVLYDDEGERVQMTQEEVQQGAGASTHFLGDRGKKRFLSKKKEIPLWSQKNVDVKQNIQKIKKGDDYEYGKGESRADQGQYVGAHQDPASTEDYTAFGESKDVGFRFPNQKEGARQDDFEYDTPKFSPGAILPPGHYSQLKEGKPPTMTDDEWREYTAKRKAVFDPKTGEITEMIKRKSGIGYKKTDNVIKDEKYLEAKKRKEEQEAIAKANKKQRKKNQKILDKEKKKNPRTIWDGTKYVKNPDYDPDWKTKQGYKHTG